MTRILIVVSDRRLGLMLAEGLLAHGHYVRLVAHPRMASALADYLLFDLVVVDIALEQEQGFDMLRESCAGPSAPRVMLLDRSDAESVRALLAHAGSVLEEASGEEEPKLAAGGVELNPWTRRARAGGLEVALTEREFSLLRIFLRHPGRVMSREDLQLHAWGHKLRLGSNAVEVYVGYLRRKLGPDVVETVYGRGYRLRS